MGSKQFSIECHKVANSIDRELVNRCYNCNLSVDDYYYQVNIFDTDVPLCSVSCYSFLSFDDALSFVRKKFDL